MVFRAGRIAFLGAGAIPASVSRSYKSRFLGADKGPAPVNEFLGAGQESAAPEKGFLGAGDVLTCP